MNHKKVWYLFLLCIFLFLRVFILFLKENDFSLEEIESDDVVIVVDSWWDISSWIHRETYSLVSVVDGDTIKILVNGEPTSVRLIGVDTPEKYSTRYGYAECFWEEASQYLKDLLKNISEVEIEYDDSQGTYDKYGRILWYLFVNGENYNQKMIEDGYAREYTYNTPYRYQQVFKTAQKQAELWNVWLRNTNTCNGERKSI